MTGLLVAAAVGLLVGLFFGLVLGAYLARDELAQATALVRRSELSGSEPGNAAPTSTEGR